MKLPHTSLEGKHLPVMIDEVLEICNPKNGGNFMDCTFGAGGFSKQFLKFQETKVVAIDRDSHVKEIAQKLKNKFKSRFAFHNKRFSELDFVSPKKFDAVVYEINNFVINLKLKMKLTYESYMNNVKVGRLLNIAIYKTIIQR